MKISLVINTCLDLGLNESEIVVKIDFLERLISIVFNRNCRKCGYRPRHEKRRVN